MADIHKLEKLAKLVRYWSLVSTTEAGFRTSYLLPFCR